MPNRAAAPKRGYGLKIGLASLLFLAAPSGAQPIAGEPAAGPAQAQSPAPAAPNALARLLAEGRPYVLITRRDLFPRASEGRDSWFTISGYYRPQDGVWTSDATGFPSPGTPWHSCPRETQCGGIHEPGMALERWYRPENGELVIIGQRLTFDAQGRVFHGERQIGFVLAPDF
jgi:hypothetical protein